MRISSLGNCCSAFVLVLGVLPASACDGGGQPAATTPVAGSGGNGGVESTGGAVGGEPGSEPSGGSGPAAGGTANGGDSGEAADAEGGRDGRAGSETTSGRGGGPDSSGGKAGAGGIGDDAAGAGGEPGPTLGISPIGLPAGRIGTPYSVEFTATGVKGEIHWTVDGSLPNGLILSDEPGTGAVISGTPSVAGPFEFRLLAEDDGGLAGARDYDLRVRSLRWLLYATDTDAYAVDLGTDPPGDPVRLNPSPGTFLGTSFLDDQPGGPFAVLSTSPEQYWVVSFAGLSPEAPVEIDGWPVFSADGRRVAYVAAPLGELPAAFVVDMSGSVPGAPVRVSSPYAAVRSPEFVASTLYYRTAVANPMDWLYSVDVTTLPPPEPVPVVGCDAGLCPVPSPDTRRVAWFDRLQSVYYVMGSRGAGPASAVPVAPELAPGACGWMLPAWASDSRWLYFRLCPCDGTCSTYRVTIDDGGPGPVQRVAPDTGTWQLSPDGARFLYENLHPLDSDPRELWVVDVSGDTPGKPQRVDGPHVDGGGFGPGLGMSYWWGPDFRHVLYSADSLHVDAFDVFMVDVTDKPTPPLRLNPEFPAFLQVYWYFSPRGDAAVWQFANSSPESAGVYGAVVTDWVPDESVALGTIASNEWHPRIDWAPDGTQVVLGFRGASAEYRLELVGFDGKAFAPSVRVGENHVIRNYRIFSPGY